MIHFIDCPKCKAKIENIPGTKCWNCGYLIPGGSPAASPINELPAEDLHYYDMGITTTYFRICPSCGAQCELGATYCWSCHVALDKQDDSASSGYSNVAPKKKNVPFSELSSKPPKKKHKQGLVDFLARAIKISKYIDEDDDSITPEEERKIKKEGKLILFHCPKCGEYYKVMFKKVRDKVKCPVCKDVFMKIPYFCTRCKRIEEFDNLGRHTCKYCNLDMILDPNYE
ncbi:MAG: hypothetical protein ACTSVI_06770 [Promethearchaeota archaeon]